MEHYLQVVLFENYLIGTWHGDENIVDNHADIYDTEIENVDLNSILQEEESQANTQQDQFLLWGSNISKPLCPQLVYFLEFVAWWSK